MKAYVAAGLLLVAVPGARGIDPRTLLLRPADIDGGVVASAPRPMRPVEYGVCGAARVVRAPEAHAAQGALGARPGYVSQAVFVFPTARQAHRHYTAYVGTESVARMEGTEVPGLGPQWTNSVTVRTGRVVLLIGVSPGFDLAVVVRKAVERARVLSSVG